MEGNGILEKERIRRGRGADSDTERRGMVRKKERKKKQLKVKAGFGNAPLSATEMEALITRDHVKEYVLTNTS